MSKSTIFRILATCFGILLAIAMIWHESPKTSAQNSNKPSKEAKPATTVSTSSDDDSLILLNSAEIDVRSAAAQASRQSVSDFAGKRMHLIRFRGPIQPSWYKMMTDAGVEVVDYIPNYTYLVYGDLAGLRSLQTESKRADSPIQWDGSYTDRYRISPDVYTTGKENNGVQRLSSDQFQIQLYKDDAANGATLKLIDSLQTSPVKGRQEIMHYVNLVAGLDEAGLNALAARPDVISIAPYTEPIKLDERQDIILVGNLTAGGVPNPTDYLGYLAGKGFTQTQFDTSGFAVDLTDSGIDNANPASPNHFLLRKLGDPAGTSRFIYSRLEGTAHAGSTLQGCDGHGNLNSTIIGGYVPGGGIFAAFPHADANLFRYGMGVAPFVKVGSSVIFDPNTFTSPNYANLQSKAYNDGARISSNSWGSSANTYTTDSQSYDALVRDAQPTGSTFPTAGNQEMTIVFAAGNNGSAANTVGSPSTGKNVITVGASENVQAFGAADQCGTTDAEADSANDIVAFSSRGPTSDLRKKPDIMLPGTHVSGGVAQSTNVSPVSGIGAANSCFTAGGVCAGPGTSDFWPLSQAWYTASSGTSHSTPAISGFAALIRQDFINRTLAPPSPALTKALMMNSARYMTGTGANDSLPSNNQGMGLADMNNYFDTFAQARVIKDEVLADKFTASGQQRTYVGTVASAAKPFHVTLSWTDVPGSTTGNAFVNNLDLEVTVGGVTYLGNVFTGGNSSSGGTADIRNNVESVFVPAGVTGNFIVKVKGTNIAGDGVPNNADALDQDFALVVSNGSETPVAVVQANSVTITAENGIPVNNAPDPGETVTVDLTLQNVGTANSASVTTTLQNSGGITPVSGPQNYGVLTSGGPAVAKSFTFTVPPGATCGGSITLSFLIDDGSSPFTFTRTYTLGTLGTGPPLVFSNTTPITINDGATGAPAATTPYGTAINVSGLTGNKRIRLKINGLSHTFPGDLDILLVGPGGQKMVVMSDVVGTADAVNTSFSLVDTAAALLPAATALTDGGEYRPSDITSGDTWPAPAPAGPYLSATPVGTSTFQSVYGADATTMNGTWSLYIVDDAGVDTGNIAGGWSLTFEFIDFVCAVPNAPIKSRADFDGDGKTDFSVFRPSTGVWYLNKSTDGFSAFTWGANGDAIVPGDWDGDGKADAAIYRPTNTVGAADFYILNSNGFTATALEWGVVGDTAVSGDFDGDGKTDAAVFRPSNGTWYIRGSGGTVRTDAFGQSGDVPMAMDNDGDGKSNLAVYRSSDNRWYIAKPTGTPAQNFDTFTFGFSTDIRVPADYDGDNKDDAAVFRPSTGQWFILRSTNGAVDTQTFGTAGDVPVPGDYDGDGKDDVAVYRGGTWYANRSNAGSIVVPFGLGTDIPVPKGYIP